MLRVAGGVVGRAARGDHGVARPQRPRSRAPRAAIAPSASSSTRATASGCSAISARTSDERPSFRPMAGKDATFAVVSARHARLLRPARSPISRLSSSTTTSAGAPGASRPRSRRAGDPRRHRRRPPRAPPRAAPRARARCARRRSSSARCRRAGPRARARRRRTSTSRRPASAKSPSPIAVAATASVTSASRPRAACHATSTVSPATWWPSAISCTVTSGRASAASPMPGSRGTSGRIALNRCVTVRTPRSNARCASAALASRVAGRDDDAAREQQVDELERARQLRRQRHLRHAPGVEQPLRAAPGRARAATPSGARRAAAATRTAPRRARRSRTGRPRCARPASRAAPRPGRPRTR